MITTAVSRPTITLIEAAVSIESSEHITLSDGTPATIRPIRPDDSARLQALHKRLSPESVYTRFMGYLKELSDQQAHDLTSLDYREKMALVATINNGGEEQIIAVARYAALTPDRPVVAECAVTIQDDYQRHGLGTALLKRLALYAFAHGIQAFMACMFATNEGMLRLIKRVGLPIEQHMSGGELEIVVRLNPEPPAPG